MVNALWIVLLGMTVIFAVLGILLLVMIFVDKPIRPQKKEEVNPIISACGISAFPMSSRVVQKLGLVINLLMHATGANTAGQIASVVAGGVMFILVPVFS
jgi:Na+-transporting methylmalonyl-CoA/oxaloacetate decarboxylase beta subunit